jgi:hypothetical protein
MGVPKPAAATMPINTEASAIVLPTEMSISPVMIRKAIGSATMARSVKLKLASDSVQGSRK